MKEFIGLKAKPYSYLKDDYEKIKKKKLLKILS